MGDLSNLDIGWRSALLLSACTPLLFVAMTLWWRDVERTASRCLAVLLLLFCVHLTPQIIGFAGAYQVWPELTFAPFNTKLWFAPLLLLHVRLLLTGQGIRQSVWLLVPGALLWVYYCIVFVSFADYRDKWAFNDAFHSPYILPLETVLTVLLTLYCAVKGWQLLMAYDRHLQINRSDFADFDPTWLRVSSTLFGVVLTLWLVFELINQVVDGLAYTTQYPVYLALTLLLGGTGCQALNHIRDEYPKMSPDRPQPAESEEAAPDWQQKAVALQDVMQARQWYLEPKLTITDLARHLGTNETYLSKTLNIGLNTNFNQFVNAARVEHAQQLIQSRPQDNLLDLAFQAGFSSKASFNRVFKEHAGQTPSAYRQACLR